MHRCVPADFLDFYPRSLAKSIASFLRKHISSTTTSPQRLRHLSTLPIEMATTNDLRVYLERSPLFAEKEEARVIKFTNKVRCACAPIGCPHAGHDGPDVAAWPGNSHCCCY